MADSSKLTDAELRKRLQDLGQAPGPITATTRSLWIKKLHSLSGKPAGSEKLSKSVEKRLSTSKSRLSARVAPTSAQATSLSDKQSSFSPKPSASDSSLSRTEPSKSSNSSSKSVTENEAKKLGSFSSDEEDEVTLDHWDGGSYVSVSDMKSSPIVFQESDTTSANRRSSAPKTRQSVSNVLLSPRVTEPVKKPSASATSSLENKKFKSFQGEFSDGEDFGSPDQGKSRASRRSTLVSRSSLVRSTNSSELQGIVGDSNIDPVNPRVVSKSSGLKSNGKSYTAGSYLLKSSSTPPELPDLSKTINAYKEQVRKSFVGKASLPDTSSLGKHEDAADEESDEEELDVEFGHRISMLKHCDAFVVASAVLVVLLGFGVYFWIPPDQLPAIAMAGSGEDEIKLKAVQESAQKFLQCLYDDLSVRAGQAECGLDISRSMNMQQMAELAAGCLGYQNQENLEPLVRNAIQLVRANESNYLTYFQVEDVPPDASSEESLDCLVSSRHTDKPVLCRIKQAAAALAFRISLVLAGIGLVFASYFILKHRWSVDDEETRKMLFFVEKIISTLKKHDAVCRRDKEVPPYLPIPHLRDMLIPPTQRKKIAHVWQKAVDFLNSSDSRIRVETQRIAGEDFEVWRWIGISTLDAVKTEKKSTSNHLGPNVEQSKCWQGPAFDEIEKVVRLPIVTPTPCLKIRYMHEGPEEKGKNWDVLVADALLEKCSQDGARLLHIYVDKDSTEGCVYVKCDSLDSAGKAFRSLYGNWFDGRLIIVKFVTLARYHQRFPDALHSSATLKPSGQHPTSLAWQEDEILPS